MLNLKVTLSPDQTEIHYNQQSLITIAEKLSATSTHRTTNTNHFY